MPPKDLKPKVPGEAPLVDDLDDELDAKAEDVLQGDAPLTDAEREELNRLRAAMKARVGAESNLPAQDAIDVESIQRPVLSRDGWVCRNNPNDQTKGFK
jgi:hypothetical protein